MAGEDLFIERPSPAPPLQKTSMWSAQFMVRVTLQYAFRILIRPTLVENCSSGFCGKPGSAKTNGKTSRRALSTGFHKYGGGCGERLVGQASCRSFLK
jgi:hypothetical protein